MNVDVAKAALGFLGRAQLQGQEVSAFQTVQQALVDIVEERTVCKPAPKPKPDDEE